METPKQYVINPDVTVHRNVDGAVMLNPDTDDAVALNPVAYLIWQNLTQPNTQNGIVNHLQNIFPDIPMDQFESDVTHFLGQMLPRGYIGSVWDEEMPLPDAIQRESDAPIVDQPTLSFEDMQPEITRIKLDQLNLDNMRFYHGGSMAGTFQRGDILFIDPAQRSNIRPGDVIVYKGFTLQDKPEDIAHRVIRSMPEGLITRGDANRHADKGLVTQDALLGRVTHLERAGRVHGVRGGRAGLWLTQGSKIWRPVQRLGTRWIKTLGRPAYRRLRESRLVSRLWWPDISRILVTTRNGLVVKYIHKRRTVAWWWPAQGSFRCRKPYDLILHQPDGRF